MDLAFSSQGFHTTENQSQRTNEIIKTCVRVDSINYWFAIEIFAVNEYMFYC
jgi:hypothetical protein